MQPTGAIADQIKKDFGSYDEFKKQFDTAGNTAFGLFSSHLPLFCSVLFTVRLHWSKDTTCREKPVFGSDVVIPFRLTLAIL